MNKFYLTMVHTDQSKASSTPIPRRNSFILESLSKTVHDIQLHGGFSYASMECWMINQNGQHVRQWALVLD